MKLRLREKPEYNILEKIFRLLPPFKRWMDSVATTEMVRRIDRMKLAEYPGIRVTREFNDGGFEYVCKSFYDGKIFGYTFRTTLDEEWYMPSVVMLKMLVAIDSVRTSKRKFTEDQSRQEK